MGEFGIMARGKTLELKVYLSHAPAHPPMAARVWSHQAQSHAAYLSLRGRLLERLDSLLRSHVGVLGTWRKSDA